MCQAEVWAPHLPLHQAGHASEALHEVGWAGRACSGASPPSLISSLFPSLSCPRLLLSAVLRGSALCVGRLGVCLGLRLRAGGALLPNCFSSLPSCICSLACCLGSPILKLLSFALYL